MTVNLLQGTPKDTKHLVWSTRITKETLLLVTKDMGPPTKTNPVPSTSISPRSDDGDSGVRPERNEQRVQRNPTSDLRRPVNEGKERKSVTGNHW